ncbi:hypothetical protein CMQ_5983 [Grosmannia clavigera kw1407]|uniref:Major facilitator superfamily transporter n=1 Tax=Grosmannia clavigera (strain kw1407 / UAMH 11150) TaxID=655863 RepID=F0XLP5_GROCL|nr:uncharacterized protein CMQ_5983 [Grosmannia clavigera kw1407]EFX01041.1 hypothetical protein CMQ_5983 [Grosmannia clavigera kw1407]
MDQTAAVTSGSSSASSSSSQTASRRNSFSILEKPSTGVSGLSSTFSSFSSSRVSLLPMPVVTTAATSAIEAAKSSFRWLPKSRISLPYSPLSSRTNPPSSPRLLLGNYFYRRVVVWGTALVALLILALVVGKHKHPEAFSFRPSPDAGSSDSTKAEAVWLNYTRLNGYYNGIRTLVPIGEYHAEFPTAEDQELALQEISTATVTGEQLAKRADDTLSGTEPTPQTDSSATVPLNAAFPDPTPFHAQPDYNSSDYRAKYYPVHRCYLDAAGLVPVPHIWAYAGVPQNQPEPLLGSHKLLGLRDDVCFERYGRYGPYGMGYSKEEGGSGQGLDVEREGSERIWAASSSGKIDYSNVNWADAQKRCYQTNAERFVAADDKISGATEYAHMSSELHMKRGQEETASPVTASNATETAEASSVTPPPNPLQKLERIAIVVRCYAGYKWTPHAVINFRALIAEVSLQSGGEYDVHILMDTRDDNLPIWADEETAERVIADNVPLEFRGLVTLWSVAQMRLLYPGMNYQPVFENPSDNDIYGVYRSPHLALQHFAQQHPEYAHYWNWEMDMRFLGSYYEFFDRLGKWAEAQQRRRIWDRSSKFYIPALHGSWDNFTALVDAEAHEAGRPSILGEVFFAGRSATRDEERGISPLPAQGCEGAVLSSFNRTSPDHNATTAGSGRTFFADRNNNYTDIPAMCGVGEPADLITLNPLFDSEDSGWVFANDVTGYNRDFAVPPRRTSIITASRLSRRLLFAMHEETWRLHHGMFAEMFPPTIALHRGFKAAYAPHPVYADRRWPLVAMERALNAGPDHSSGAGRDSPFNQSNEHYFRGLTWYYNSDFAGRMWRRWLGFLQPLDDPRAPKPLKSNDTMAQSLSGLGGGPGEEMRESGRMCMRSVLVHPIKFESLEEILP